MLRKCLLVTTLVALSQVGAVRAEEARALLTTENRFPELHQAELSYLLENVSYDAMDYRTHSALIRFGLIENLTARLQVPYVNRDAEFGEDADGVGDLKLGFDLKAWEDIFRYPYVIPHFDLSMPTGDEDEGLGSGETSYSIGVSLGTVTYDELHWVLDGTYATDEDLRGGIVDDAFKLSLSIIWDISDRFSVSGEGRLTDYQDLSEQSTLLGGGMSYAWTEDLGMTLFVGKYADDVMGEDQRFDLKVSYTF